MILLRKLALALCLACSCITLSSNAQTIESTGNVVNNSNWSNAVYQNQLTCWAYGDPGYCGPNPIVRPGGNINFSYGTVDLHQIQAISSILPNSGTGLQVNGFTFGFTAKNGNGWDNGRQDYLSAYVKFYGANGTQGPEYDYTAYTNQKYNWTQFSFSETFATPYAAPELSSVRYGLIGRDNNFWVGPYGPEVFGVNFSLKYSVDPCATNKFSSPSCAGYFDALAKLAPAATTTDTTVAYTPPPEPPEPAPPPPGSPPPQQQAQAGPTPTPGAPPPPGSPPPQQQNAQQPGPAVGPASNNPQEKSSGGAPNVGFALSLIAKNSEREKAIAQQVVAMAESQAQAAGDKAQQLATSVASAAVAASTTSSDTAFSGNGIQVSSSSSRSNTVVNVTAQQPISSLAQNIQGYNAAVNIQQTAMLQLLTPTSIEQIQSTQNYSIFAVQEYRQQETEQVNQQVNFLTDLNNPIKQILDAQQFQQAVVDQPQQTQRRDIAPNELAVGVNLAQMATIPQGYASYTNFILRDASFYEPKEVYKNQTVVDNIRVLRGLGSDQKHQDLVNLQYK
jgi:hypothetical protein